MAAGKSTGYARTVVLCAKADTLAARDKARAKTRYGGWTARALDALLHAGTPKLGLWLDSTDMTVDQTVATILAQPDATQSGIA